MPATARGARRWNDANVLAFGLRLTTATLVEELLDAFLAAEADPSEAANVAKLAEPTTNERPSYQLGDALARAAGRSPGG